MSTSPLLIGMQVAAAILLVLGIRACGIGDGLASRKKLWISTVLWVVAGILAAPFAAALLRRFSAMDVVFLIFFLVGFVVVVAVTVRWRPASSDHPTPGDDHS